jgi:hypothetical protein
MGHLLLSHIAQAKHEIHDSPQFGENGREHWRANFCFSAFRRRMEPILTEFLGA